MLFVPRGSTAQDLDRDLAKGDLIPENMSVAALTTVGAGTWTAAQIAGGIIRRTGPVGGYTDTTDTSENIRQALEGLSGGACLGMSFLFIFLNDVAQAHTFAAGVGVTNTGTVSTAASLKRVYNVSVVNDTPQQIFLASQTNASAVITGLTAAQTALLSVGMAASGTSIAASSFINSIQPGVGVTLSVATTATLVNNAITFSPVINFEGLFAGTA